VDFHGWCTQNDINEAGNISRRDIGRYVDHLVDQGYAYSTIVRSRYASVSACLNYLAREREISQNPIDRIDKKAIKKKARNAKSESEKKDEIGAKDHLSREEVYRLADHVPEPADRNELLIKLMFWTGLRASEVVLVDIGDDGTLDGPDSDIHPETPKIEAYGVKSDEARTVAYPRSEINPLLRDWVSHGRLRYKCADSTDRLFIGPKGPLTESGLGRVVTEAADNADMQETKRESRDGREYQRVTPHILRHSHAMHYRNEEEVPIEDIKDHLGHENLQTTERFYATGTEERMIDRFGE
jgi:integrase/recombinase XerD